MSEQWKAVPAKLDKAMFSKMIKRDLLNMDRQAFQSYADDYKIMLSAAPDTHVAVRKDHYDELVSLLSGIYGTGFLSITDDSSDYHRDLCRRADSFMETIRAIKEKE